MDAGIIAAQDGAHLRAILRLGAPLVVNNLAYSGMLFADTVMSGHIGADALAAVAVGGNALALLSLIGTGMMMALSPIVAHEFGAGRDVSAGANFARRCGSYLRCRCCPLAARSMQSVRSPRWEPMHRSCRQRPLREGDCWGIPAMFATQAPTYTQGSGARARYGHDRARAAGQRAAELGVHVRSLRAGARRRRHRCRKCNHVGRAAVMLGLVSGRSLRGSACSDLERPVASRPRRSCVVAAVHGLVARRGFTFIGADADGGSLGAGIVAAHQVALSYRRDFMIPAAFHSATTVRVGHMLGRGSRDEARRAGYTGIALCTGIMVVSAGILIVARHAIADIYTDDRAVIDLAARLLLLAGFFQISDGLQLGCAGALRGYQDARVPLAITAISYWGIGFALAWVFGIVRGGGAPGVWLGLIAGLTSAGALLALRYRVISTR
jgi:MATE family multidrug resistance protein